MSRKSGKLIQHEDGRKGIAYHSDQIQKLLNNDEMIVKWFKDDSMKEIDPKKYKVAFQKITVIGFTD